MSLDLENNGHPIKVLIADGSSNYYLEADETTGGRKSYTFVAGSDPVTIRFIRMNTGLSTFSVDNVKLSHNYYTADVISAQDYYAFGMLMPGRIYNPGNYRFGFNGIESVDEMKGAGNYYSTYYRGYDPRLGRWLSPDPVFQPWQSPYAAMNNNPTNMVDPLGNEAITAAVVVKAIVTAVKNAISAVGKAISSAFKGIVKGGKVGSRSKFGAENALTIAAKTAKSGIGAGIIKGVLATIAGGSTNAVKDMTRTGDQTIGGGSSSPSMREVYTNYGNNSGNNNSGNYPHGDELKKTFLPDAYDNIYKFTEQPNFADEFNITFDRKGQERFGELFIGTNLKEIPQNDRETYTGKVVRIQTQLADKSLITPENKNGVIEGTQLRIQLSSDQIPDTKSFIMGNSVPESLPRIDLGNGKSIIYVIQIAIEFPN